MSKKFLRTGSKKFKRLGKGRKKLQRWRRARGRDNKIREGIRGKPKKVKIGFKNKRAERGKIKGKKPVFVKNLDETEKTEKGDLIIIAKVGKKKRLEIEKKIKEKGGEILNEKKLKINDKTEEK